MLKFVVVGWFRQILLGLDESGPMLGLKLLVGPRWREFHCLAAPPLSWWIQIWLVETLQVILLGARRVGTGQIVEQAGRR